MVFSDLLAFKGVDWETADKVRDELRQRGIELQESPQGVRWFRSSSSPKRE